MTKFIKVINVVLLMIIILCNYGFPNILSNSILISHRGLRNIDQGVEANSFEAFRNTGIAGFYACEGDLQYNREYNWFYMAHDETNNVEKSLSYCGFQEFLIINKIKNCRPFIDIRYSVDIDKMVKIINDLKCNDIVICQCANENQLEALKDKGLDICLLTSPDLLLSGKWFKIALKYKVKMINISSTYVSKQFIELCHRDNIKVCTYCVDSPYDRNKYLSLGIDYIMTNNQ